VGTRPHPLHRVTPLARCYGFGSGLRPCRAETLCQDLIGSPWGAPRGSGVLGTRVPGGTNGRARLSQGEPWNPVAPAPPMAARLLVGQVG
jgi:hypothetical protein